MIFRLIRRHPWLTALAVLSIGVLGLHLTLDWRAQNAWDRYAAEAQRQKVILVWENFVPPAIPSERNFARLPMFEKVIVDVGLSSGFEFPNRAISIPPFLDPLKSEDLDWRPWQLYFQKMGWLVKLSDNPPLDILRALENLQPAFTEWGQWRARPESRFDAALYRKVYPLYPFSKTISDATRMFRLRALAHLAIGDPTKAWSDLEELRQVYRAIENEPGIDTGFLRVAGVTSLCCSVGEGMWRHVWTEAELGRIAAMLDEFNLGKDLDWMIASQRLLKNQEFEEMLKMSARERGRMLWNPGIFSITYIPWTEIPVTTLLPRWYFRDNQLEVNRTIDRVEETLKTGRLPLDGRFAISNGLENETPITQRRYALAHSESPFYPKLIQRYRDLQTLWEQTRQAVALERAYLTQGNYPVSAAELAPRFLPSAPFDNYSGELLVYRRNGKRSYVLYSVGRNLLDDGGSVDPLVPSYKQPDIVWPYAPPP